MTGIAAGITMNSNTVFTYSIGNFPTLRSLEQIRNDVCYHECNVKIVVIDGGLAYGTLGVAHYVYRDLAKMRTPANMAVVASGDLKEVVRAIEAIIQKSGPYYLRCGKGKRTNSSPK